MKELNTRSQTPMTQTDAIRRFLESAKRYPILTPSEEVEIFEKYSKTKSKELRDKIMCCNQLFVFAVAKKYTSDPDVAMDYFAEGMIGLSEAIDKFDVTRGFKFISFAVWYVRKQINMYMEEISPRGCRNCIWYIADKIRSRYIAEHEMDIDPNELKKLVEKKLGRKIYDFDINDLSLVSISSEYDDESFETSPEFNEATCSYNDIERHIADDANVQKAEACLKLLPERDEDIVRMFFGIGYPRSYTYGDIADKYKLTESRIGSIIRESLAKIKYKTHGRS